MITIKKVNIHLSLLLYIILCAFTGFLKDGLLIISVLLFHELSHILMIKLYKGKIIKIDLTLIGGLMDIELKQENMFNKIVVDSVRHH